MEIIFADDNTLISCSADQTIKIWDIQRSTCKQTLHTKDQVRSLAVSPNSRTIAAGLLSGSIELFGKKER